MTQLEEGRILCYLQVIQVIELPLSYYNSATLVTINLRNLARNGRVPWENLRSYTLWAAQVGMFKKKALQFQGVWASDFLGKFSKFSTWTIMGETSNFKGVIMSSTNESLFYHVLSMDWFKGKVTGNTNISWKNLWFPVGFPTKTNPLRLQLQPAKSPRVLAWCAAQTPCGTSGCLRSNVARRVAPQWSG